MVDQVKVKAEKYFAILMDRAHQGPVIVASSQVRCALWGELRAKCG